MTARQRRYQHFKYVVDVVLSLAALLVLFIPFCVIAAVQKLREPKEPVFFSQQRYGRGGRLFSVLKFRSMRSESSCEPSDSDAGAEAQVTGFGRFLRDTSIDELPQLVQVVLGKMSLVGPRPLIPQEEDIHVLRAQCGIYQLRPGITGWAQIHGRDRLSIEEKIYYDKQYLENMCCAIDVKILWLTARMMLPYWRAKDG